MRTREENTDLFEIMTRGTMASAFAYSNANPEPRHWDMMQGRQEMTMRDIGEVGALTGFNMNLQLSQNRHLENSDED